MEPPAPTLDTLRQRALLLLPAQKTTFLSGESRLTWQQARVSVRGTLLEPLHCPFLRVPFLTPHPKTH